MQGSARDIQQARSNIRATLAGAQSCTDRLRSEAYKYLKRFVNLAPTDGAARDHDRRSSQPAYWYSRFRSPLAAANDATACSKSTIHLIRVKIHSAQQPLQGFPEIPCNGTREPR